MKKFLFAALFLAGFLLLADPALADHNCRRVVSFEQVQQAPVCYQQQLVQPVVVERVQYAQPVVVRQQVIRQRVVRQPVVIQQRVIRQRSVIRRERLLDFGGRRNVQLGIFNFSR